MEEKDKIELRSEEVQEILGHIPSRIIRYGITVIFSVIFVLFIGSFFFKYPDILTAPVEVVSENPPAVIVANASGNLEHLFVSDSQKVEPHTLLAVIQNPANPEDMAKLGESIENLSHPDKVTDTAILSQWPQNLELGDVQAAYSVFLKTSKTYRHFLTLNYLPRKADALQAKQTELDKYAAIMKEQSRLKAQDYELAKNQFRRDSGLYQKDVISLAAYEKSRKELIQHQMAWQNAQSAVVNTTMQLQDLQQQIVDLQLEHEKQLAQYHDLLQEQFNNLKSHIDWWYNTYMLVSPIEGIVAINRVWSSNQYIKAGEEVFTVIPQKTSEIIGRVNLEAKGAGKVKVGQRVNIKFDNYPYQEFGMITARVSSVSLVPAQQKYTVEIKLPDTLMTNYGNTLMFSQKMPGTAEIITEDLPLIARIFNPLKAILKKHWGS